MLKLVELPGFERRKPTQISGGQAQRVALARALINRPSVLLLDEPLGALDLKLRKQMQVELKRIQQEVGITFIFVTHDQEEAMTMSDRIAVMNHGQLRAARRPGESCTSGRRPGSSPASSGVSNLLADDGRRQRRRLRRSPSWPTTRRSASRAPWSKGLDDVRDRRPAREDPAARADRRRSRTGVNQLHGHRPRRVVPRRLDAATSSRPAAAARSRSTSRTSSAPRAPSCGTRARRSG